MSTTIWKWLEPEDLERLERALAEVRRSALPQRARSWLEADSTAKRLLHPEPGPPLARWVLRISQTFHGSELSSHIALAVALLAHEDDATRSGAGDAGSPTDAPDALTRWSLAWSLLSAAIPDRAGAVASWLLTHGAEPQTRAIPDGDGAWTRALVLGFGLPVLLAGGEPAPWVALARAAAPLVALLASWERLWLEPSERDIDEAVLSSWVAHGLATPAGQRILFAYAGERRSAPRRDEVRAALREPSVLEAVRGHWVATMASARATLSASTSACGEAFLRALEGGFSFLETFLWMRSLTSTGPGPHPWTWETLDVDIRRAVERIGLDPRWSSSLDVQRWGVSPLEADLVADGFPRGLIELALRELLPGREPRVRELLLEIPAGELRYYRHWRGIPPDADSLGLMLRLASGLPDVPAERLESWIALMAENLGEDGVPRVWFRRSPAGATHEPPQLDWRGDDCTACLLSLALGLVQLDAARFERTLSAILSAALARFRGEGFTGTHHYCPEFASHLFLLLAEALPRADVARALREEVRRCAAALVRQALATQRLDGSWQSPQRTAWNVIALCLHHPDEAALTRAARYLSETQRGDGSWLPELLYYTVGKPGYMVEYRGLEVTTAFCAQALARVRRMALARGWAH
jgi:hypothetical protein